MSNQRTVGEYLVGLLAKNGVDTIFGIPGVHTLELYRGLRASGMRHVLPRHEQGAAFAADGYARISGRPGVCFLISGPGVGNALTAIGQAYSDSVPMLVISSVCASDTLGKRRGALHEVSDQRAMTAPVTAFSATALSGEDVRDHLARALAIFAAGRPRPVHIEVPIDVLARTTSLDLESLRLSISAPGPTSEVVAAAAELLRAARRPILIVGGGAIGAGDAVRQIAEAIGAMVITTVAAKGVLPDDHPAHLGATLQLPAIQDLVREADVVVAAGTELAETDSYVDTVPMSGKLVRIDLDRDAFSGRYRPHLGILADALLTLEAIAARLREQPRPARPFADRILRAKAVASLERKALAHVGILDALRRALPPEGAVFSDMTQIAYTGNAMFSVPQPRSWFHPSGFGTLGYALPAAIGGKLAAPERPVVALAGDYGFQFTMAEFGTAVDQQLALPVVIWNNDRLGQIADDMGARGITEVGVQARSPDLSAIARAYGAVGVRANSLEAVQDCVGEALERNGPTLIEIREDDFV